MSYMSNNFDPTKHSIFKPENIEKYKGDTYPICRSSYEVKFCRWLDNNPNVLEWASETVEINYFDPVSKKKRRYYRDFYMKVVNKDGNVIRYIIEIKRNKETKPPVVRKNKKIKSMIYEQNTWETNKAKWVAATEWCKLHGMSFKLVTENQLFH